MKKMNSIKPKSTTVAALVREQASVYGKAEAVVAADKRLSYIELYEQSRVVAKSLTAYGVKPKDHVAILMSNRIEWITTFLGLQLIGATAVAINTWSSPRELAYTLEHSDVKFLLAVESFKKSHYFNLVHEILNNSQLPELKGAVWLSDLNSQIIANENAFSVDWNLFLASSHKISDQTLDVLIDQVQPEDVSVLLYTSGSTATPKGILLQQDNWIENSWNIGERQHITPKDRLWLAVSLFWSFGCVNAFPNIFSHGGCVVLQEHFDAKVALDLIEIEKCSVIYGTPNMLQAMIEHPNRATKDLSSLRTGAMIGTPEQIMWAVELGAKEICNIYGLSETYGNCAVIDSHEDLAIRLQSVGQPLDGVEVKIYDLETERELPPNEVGEIRVKGPMFLNYYKDPEKTKESYDENNYFKTGDLGLLDEKGRIYYKGRLKEMVKSGGINIAPIEVEEVLMRHPKVRTAYVIGVPDKHLDERLVAFIIPKDGKSVDVEELKRFGKQELAGYKNPSEFRIISDSQLPLTTTGKIQKLKLKTLLE